MNPAKPYGLWPGVLHVAAAVTCEDKTIMPRQCLRKKYIQISVLKIGLMHWKN